MALTELPAVEVARSASLASRHLATLSNEERNVALTFLHKALEENRDLILAANAKDMKIAKDGAAAEGGLSSSAIKRLDLSGPGKYEDMLKGIESVRDLDDPLGQVSLQTELDEGLILERVSCPIGVLLIIFEARPEVIANIAALAIKSGNAAILKGGKESTESFKAIATVVSNAIEKSKVDVASVQLVQTRDAVSALLAQDSLIDLVIPRGSNELVRFVKDNTKIPVLGHADGLCSAYIHFDADTETAKKVIVDSKTDYPAACNSLESLLVHADTLNTVFPEVAAALLEKGVTLRCDEDSKKALMESPLVEDSSLIQQSTESDYDTEFLDLQLAVKTIRVDAEADKAKDHLQTAIDHINMHSSKHTDLILTQSADAAKRFTAGIDSAGVFWNASTRFADGMRFGFGTEVGISTNKIHSRGPVGLEGLTIYKYLVRGNGHRAADYRSGDGGRKYTHKDLLKKGL